MTYQVKLDVFEGPFDLLLQIIARRRLDVTEIDLADITSDFLEKLGEHLEELDLETATRFLVVAATLVEIKAAQLLPREERQAVEDLLGDARDMLYARLLEYRAFRDVARAVSHRLDRFQHQYPREVAPESWMLKLVPATDLPIDVYGLAVLAAGIAAPPPEPEIDLTHIRRSYLTIRDAAEQVLAAMPSPGEPVRYSAIVDGRDRADRVVIFLALLELFKLGQVDLEQQALHDPISVTRLDGAQGLDVLDDDWEDAASDRPDAAARSEEIVDDGGHDDERAPNDDVASLASSGSGTA